MLQAADVVTRDDAQVCDAEILEKLAWLGEVDHHAPNTTRQAERRPADDRQRLDYSVVGGLALLPGARQLERGEVLAEGPHGRADRHGVVVEDDQHLSLAVADVVESLEREPADECGVADDHGDLFHGMAHVAGCRKSLGDGQPGGGVPTVEDVVLRLRASREPADPAQLSQCAELGIPAREQLVGVSLMPSVPDDLVSRRLQHSVQRDSHLDHAQRRPQVTARLGNRGDYALADLGSKAVEVIVTEALQGGQDCQVITPGRTPVSPQLRRRSARSGAT